LTGLCRQVQPWPKGASFSFLASDYPTGRKPVFFPRRIGGAFFPIFSLRATRASLSFFFFFFCGHGRLSTPSNRRPPFSSGHLPPSPFPFFAQANYEAIFPPSLLFFLKKVNLFFPFTPSSRLSLCLSPTLARQSFTWLFFFLFFVSWVAAPDAAFLRGVARNAPGLFRQTIVEVSFFP